MENASKAILMAAGILIGVMIISIGVYLFATFGGTSQNIQEQIDGRVLAEFNNNFEKYNSVDCTIHDIISLAGFAKKNNQDFNFTDSDINNEYYVRVFIENISGSPYNNKDLTLSNINEDDYMNLLNNYSIKYTIDSSTGKSTAETQYFTCVNIQYSIIENEQRVKSIKFRKN